MQQRAFSNIMWILPALAVALAAGLATTDPYRIC